MSPTNTVTATTHLNGLKPFIVACMAITGLLSPGIFAAPSPLPIHINADSVVIDQNALSSRYSGQVELIHGDMKLTADTLTAQTKNKRLDTLDAHGSPANISSISDDGQSMQGEASHIQYNARSRMIILQGNARLIQNGNTIESERIEYNLAKGILKAGGSMPGSRVEVILLPPED